MKLNLLIFINTSSVLWLALVKMAWTEWPKNIIYDLSFIIYIFYT